MQTAMDEKVRELAYALWLADGQVEGRHVEHWCAAEREVVRGEEPPAPRKRARVRRLSKSIS
jgi:hypothetical protein